MICNFFMKVLRAGKQCGDMDIVPGIHSMSRSNRESAYEWLNKWFDKEAEGKAEAVLEPEKIETLWCTESGNTIISLGGETGQTLNAKRADHDLQTRNEFNQAKRTYCITNWINITAKYPGTSKYTHLKHLPAKISQLKS